MSQTPFKHFSSHIHSNIFFNLIDQKYHVNIESNKNYEWNIFLVFFTWSLWKWVWILHFTAHLTWTSHLLKYSIITRAKWYCFRQHKSRLFILFERGQGTNSCGAATIYLSLKKHLTLITAHKKLGGQMGEMFADNETEW